MIVTMGIVEITTSHNASSNHAPQYTSKLAHGITDVLPYNGVSVGAISWHLGVSSLAGFWQTLAALPIVGLVQEVFISNHGAGRNGGEIDRVSTLTSGRWN